MEKEIIEGNKLIAEFMGLSMLHNQTRLETLKYHSSWDWIIPVIDKIEDSEEYYKYLVETSGPFGKDDLINTKYISRTWENVIEFLEWYKLIKLTK